MMPDQYVIESHFWSTEKMSVVYNHLESLLCNTKFELIAIPRTHLARAEKRHLFDLNLSPASLLHVKFEEKVSTIDILRPEFKKFIGGSISTSQPSLGSKDSKESNSSKPDLLKKVPKWLKFGNNK
eukprot:NODE_286_length_10728_cov_0.553298.p9 type:complete len:126 gc:universal NODE_286_length_10728_cov_0.553298:8155-8532(+)